MKIKPSITFTFIFFVSIFSIHFTRARFADRSLATSRSEHHPAEVVRRLDAPGFSMNHVRIVDQRRFGDCYANAAAQLIDAYRFSHGDEKTDFHTSALVLASDTKLSEHSESVDAGRPCDAINEVAYSGVCNDEAYTLRNGERIEQYMYRYAQMQWALQHPNTPAPTLFDRLNVTGELVSLIANSVEAGLEAQKYSSQIRNELSAGGVDRSVLPPQLDLDASLLFRGTAELVRTVKRVGCSGTNHMNVWVPACQADDHLVPIDAPAQIPANFADIDNYHASRLQRQMMDLLDRSNPQPVGIEYCSQILSQGINFDSKVATLGWKQGCERHASIVIGYRTNVKSNSTEFLLRNSWGPGCYNYSKNWDCDPQTGLVWIDASALAKNVYNIFWLNP